LSKKGLCKYEKYYFYTTHEIKQLLEQTRIGVIFMVLGVLMLVVPLILNITESSIRMFVPMVGLLLLLFGFPIILGSKKDKNTET
jgi:hypothetical protein